MNTSAPTKKFTNGNNDEQFKSTYTKMFVDMMHSFMECTEDVQKIIVEMIEIATDPNVDVQDQEMALDTISEALFPIYSNGKLGFDLEEFEKELDEASPEMAALTAELDKEEAEFASRVDRLMGEKKITQTDLAEKLGVNQSAISMMLNRNCRPQQRTVKRIAEALGVEPGELWPQ